MEYILTLIFVMLLLLIFYLANKIQLDRQKYKARLDVLQDFIQDLNKHQENREQQLYFSQELKERLKQITTDLNQNIFDLNYYLFEENYQKKK
jgi:predicted Holliday junction resolvase-like endonuclease